MAELSNLIPIERTARGDIGASVYVQDQTTEILDVPFLFDRGFFTLAANTTRDTNAFAATAGHGIQVGEVLEFANQVTFMQAKAISVVDDIIVIDTPFNHEYTPADVMVRSTDDMRVNGSVTPVIFTIKPLAGQAGDITRIIIVIESNSSMDFTKFGSLSALQNGVVLRVKREGGDYRNIMNFKTNGEFIENSFDHDFQEKTGGGGFGFVGRSTFAGQDKRGVVVRLDGDLGEELQIVIQDNISTGLTKFKIKGQGSEIQE